MKCFVDNVDVDDGTTIDWLMMLRLWICAHVYVCLLEKEKENTKISMHTPTVIGKRSIDGVQVTGQSQIRYLFVEEIVRT